MATIRDYMSSEVSPVREDTTLVEAAQQMRISGVGGVPVLDSADEKCVGILTERDVVVRVLAEERDPRAAVVRDAATLRPVMCRPDDDLATALAQMREEEIQHLPVIAEGRVVGVISLADIVFRRPDEERERSSSLPFEVGDRPARGEAPTVIVPMADRQDLDFTYLLIDRIFRLSPGELANFSGAKYDGNFSLTLEQAQRRKHECVGEERASSRLVRSLERALIETRLPKDRARGGLGTQEPDEVRSASKAGYAQTGATSLIASPIPNAEPSESIDENRNVGVVMKYLFGPISLDAR